MNEVIEYMKYIAELGISSYLIYWMTKRLQNDLSEIKAKLGELIDLAKKTA